MVLNSFFFGGSAPAIRVIWSTFTAHLDPIQPVTTRMKKAATKFLELRTKPLGYLGYLPSVLPEFEILEIRKHWKKSLNWTGTTDQEIYALHLYYHAFDMELLRAHLAANHIGRVDFLINALLRSAFHIADFIWCFLSYFFSRDEYVITYKHLKNFGSDNLVVTYTKGKSRDLIFEGFKSHDVVDLNIVKSSNNERELASFKLRFNDLFKVLRIKSKYPFIRTQIIKETIVAEELFPHALRLLKENHQTVSVCLREGLPPIYRQLVETAKSMNIPTVCIDPSGVLARVIDTNCDHLFVPFRGRKSQLVAQEHVLNDNPFFDWRSLAEGNQAPQSIAFVSDLGTLGYEKKRKTDEMILEAVSRNSELNCLVRPHPQVWNNPSEITYYEDLTKTYGTGVFLDLAPRFEDVLNNVSVVITGYSSVTIEDALLCGKPVIIASLEDPIVFSEYEEMGAGFVEVCTTLDEICNSISRFRQMSPMTLKRSWLKMLEHNGIQLDTPCDLEARIRAVTEVK